MAGDENGVTITPSSESGVVADISGLSPDSTLQVEEPGTYNITNDDGETTQITIPESLPADQRTIVTDKDGVVSAYDPNDFAVDGNTDLEAIVEQIAEDPYGYDNYPEDEADRDPLTEYEPDVEDYDHDLAFDLDNTEDEAADYDFSENEGKKRVSLEGGDQNLTFNDEGDNIAVVADSATGVKDITLGDGGDNVVIGETDDAEITVHAGEGEDDIVAKDDVTVETNDKGKTKVTPLNDATITLDGYGDEEFENGTGVQTSLGDIAKAIEKAQLYLILKRQAAMKTLPAVQKLTSMIRLTLKAQAATAHLPK